MYESDSIQHQPPRAAVRCRLSTIAGLAAATMLCLVPAAPSVAEQRPSKDLGLDLAERFGRLALDCVHREYPNKIAHVMAEDGDARPPRELTPAFYGCYDWHSAVHGHWLLARLARSYPQSPLANPARAALGQSLQASNIAAEVAYLQGAGRVSFERPYGLAWLLQLAAELRQWEDSDAQAWAKALAPLESLAAERLREWIPKLTHPIRIGEHSQTAFAFGLIVDWARIAEDSTTLRAVRKATFDFYTEDRNCPIDYEPSGHDFLSPCLAEADLIRRFLDPTEFAAWLGAFLPQIPYEDMDQEWLQPAQVSDPEDPKLAHLDGLNLSRAWMLEGIASGLPVLDPRLLPILGAARAHREAGLAAVTGEHYEGGHWLGSFAMYLVSDRGGSQVLSSGPIELIYRDITREQAEQVVLARAERALADVTGYLGLEYSDKIVVDVSRQHRGPNQFRNVVRIPAGPLSDDDPSARSGISMVHEIVHVVAASAYRPDRFYDDGLAVHLQEKFGLASSYPQFEEDLHLATAELAREEGDYIPLAITEQTRRRTRSRNQRRLAYLQEGSFTRFLIDSHGLEKYMELYSGQSLEAVYGKGLEALENEWKAHLAALPQLHN